jgi:hypothetical protein
MTEWFRLLLNKTIKLCYENILMLVKVIILLDVSLYGLISLHSRWGTAFGMEK